MTYKEFKKAVAEKAGISVYRLEKEIKDGYCFPDAEEVKLAGDWRCYCRMIGGGTSQSYADDVIAEKIENEAKDIKEYLGM